MSAITCHVRQDILDAAPERVKMFCQTGAHNRIAYVLKRLSLESAHFGEIFPAEDGLALSDEAVKRRIKLWLETWVIPELENAYDQVKPKAKKS